MSEPLYTDIRKYPLMIDIVADLPSGGLEAFYTEVWNDFHRWSEEKDIEETFLGK